MQDVIVVGAGPAGATAAKYIAKAGLNTLIVEKDVLPMDKTCAGGVSSQALESLDRNIPKHLVKRQCFGASVRYNEHVLESRSEKFIASMVSRSEFDNHLTAKAVDSGAVLFQNTRVKSVDIKHDFVEVNTTAGVFKSKALIGADGVNSVCARCVRPRFKSSEIAFSLAAEIPVSGEYIGEYFSESLLSNYQCRCNHEFGGNLKLSIYPSGNR